MRWRRYNPFPEKHRWGRFLAFVCVLATVILFMGLRTTQVGLMVALGLYLGWMFRRG